MKQYKESLKEKIVEYLISRTGHWVNGGEIEKLAMTMTKRYKASCASRRCRELVNGDMSRRCKDLLNEGIIIKKIEKGSVWYRYKIDMILKYDFAKGYKPTKDKIYVIY